MPRRTEDRETNTPIPVKDGPTEFSTRVGNILQGLILAALVGIVTLLYDIKEELAQFNTRQSVQEEQIKHLRLMMN